MRNEIIKTVDVTTFKNYIYTIRGVQVVVDRDLARLYNVETKVLNQAVKRNIERFPEEFRLQLTQYEYEYLLRSHFVTSRDIHGGDRYLPYAFTEQGVAMLSAVLRSPIAVKISIDIMKAFVAMRQKLSSNNLISNRLTHIEKKQLETDTKLEQLFAAFETQNPIPKQGIFFNGQVYDAHTLVTQIIEQANHSIILIDNYIDNSVISLFTKRKEGVKITIYTKNPPPTLKLDVAKFNQQYKNLEINELHDAHDRFMIIDEVTTYHIGASLKDLGKKWFAFSQIKNQTALIMKALDSASSKQTT
ncbi:MAG: ORF6N domain-containing protein [Breznakibacter sp.]|nr:ORF6N domain-containing protein [Breznakibacter sp.]